MTRALADSESVAAALQGVMRAVCETEGWACGRYFRRDAAAGVLRFSEFWSAPGAGIEPFMEESRPLVFGPGFGLVGKVWQSGKALWVADASKDPRSAQTGFSLKSGMRGALVFPVLSDDQVMGVFAFNSRELRRPDDRLTQAIQIIGSQIGQYEKRKRAEEELRRFRLAMDTSIDSIYLTDPANLRFVDVNAAACHRLGYTREQLLNMGPQDVLVVDREQLKRLYDEVIAAGERGTNEESPYITKDGHRRWTELHRRALRSDGGWLIVTFGRDITDRKLAQEVLRESEERFRSLTRLSSDWYWEQDDQFRFTFFSGFLKEKVGLNAAAHIGKRRWEVHAKSPSAEGWQRHKAMLARHEPFYDLEVCRIGPDEREHWAAISGTPIFKDNGEFEGYRGVGKDITERKLAEKRRDIEHAVTRWLSESGSLGTAIRGIIQTICERLDWDCGARWSPDKKHETLRCLETWGRDDSAIAAFMAEMRRNPHPLGTEGLIRRSFAIGAPVAIEDVTQRTDFLRAASAARAGFRGAMAVPLKIDHRVFGVIELFSRDALRPDAWLLETMSGIGNQIAQSMARREAEAATRRAQDLARSNADLQQFAYVASHDLQEPLRMISSYTQLLVRRTEGKMDQDAREFADFIVDGAARMKQLIEDLLAYSRIGSRGPAFKPVDCEAVLGKVLANLGLAIEQNGATVTHAPLPAITADESQLAQLLQNLIGNAIKFRSAQAPRVHVSAREHVDAWVLAVRDNGIGIEQQFHERIFVMFQRLHGKSEYPGTGIGLAICRKVIEHHGGHIQVESEPGHGCTFYCALAKHPGVESEYSLDQA